MARSISKISSVNSSAANPPGNPPPGDKSFGIDPYIHFYEIEYGDNTE